MINIDGEKGSCALISIIVGKGMGVNDCLVLMMGKILCFGYKFWGRG